MIRRALLIALAALTYGCSTEEAPIPATGPLKGQLSVDIRELADVEVRGSGPAIDVTIKLSKGFGVAPEGTSLTGAGRVEAFSEAGMTLYTARFDAPAVPGGAGRCGAEAVSLALSLHQREGARVSGSLAAYCGAGVFSGTPARILRLAGDLAR
jgi:hypothetical protein